MKMFAPRAGIPTIVAATIVILLSLVRLPASFNWFKMRGAGHSYMELDELAGGYPGVDRIPPAQMEQMRQRALQDGTKCGILMVLAELACVVLLLIAIGLISKSTARQFKRALRLCFPVTWLLGLFFLSLGVSYWGYPFPYSLGPCLVVYILIAALLWILIGIAVLIRGKQQTKQ